jgi:hypothetical protein
VQNTSQSETTSIEEYVAIMCRTCGVPLLWQAGTLLAKCRCSVILNPEVLAVIEQNNLEHPNGYYI